MILYESAPRRVNVHPFARRNVEHDREQRARRHDFIGRVRRDLQMIGRDAAGRHGPAVRAQCEHHARDSGAFLERLFEEARGHDPLTIDHERSGKGDAVVGRRLLNRGIENAVALDRARSRIRQERERDAATCAEIGHHRP